MRLARILFVGLGLLLPATVYAQTPDTITQLLVEVRALRIAMERAATVGARIQLLVARVQLQEQRIAELSRRLVTVRDEMTRIDSQLATTAAEAKRMEAALSLAAMPPDERPHIERMVETFKTQNAITEKRRQDLVNEEAQLTQQIAADQGRWSDINSQLDQLEQSLVKQ